MILTEWLQIPYYGLKIYKRAMDNYFEIKRLKEGLIEDCFTNRVILLQQTISKDKTVIFHCVSIFCNMAYWGRRTGADWHDNGAENTT